MRSGAVRTAIDIQDDRPGIPQAVNECRQDQYADDIRTYTSNKECRSEHDQETEMPNGIGVIGLEFFTHRDDHRTTEQADQPLNDHEGGIGYPVFPEVPWLNINKENIGLAQ